MKGVACQWTIFAHHFAGVTRWSAQRVRDVCQTDSLPGIFASDVEALEAALEIARQSQTTQKNPKQSETQT